jgi:hypothetical protein
MKRVRSSSSVREASSVLAGDTPVLGCADGLAGVSEAVTDAACLLVLFVALMPRACVAQTVQQAIDARQWSAIPKKVAQQK